MKNLKIRKMERELRNERRVNAVLCLMAIGLCVLLVGTTGCATLSRTLHLKSDEVVEFEHALAATHGAPYEGANATLAALFAGFSKNDAKILEANGLGELAGVLEICRDIPVEIQFWPSPQGLRVTVKHSCSHEIPGIGFGPGISHSERERRMIIGDIKFSSDPDAELSREALAERYNGVLTYADDGARDPHVAQEFRTQFAQLLATDQVADHNLTVTTERHNGKRFVGYNLSYRSLIFGYQLDRGLGAFGAMVEHYAGNGNGVVTPWEVEKFSVDAVFYLAVAHDRVAPSDFDLVAKQSGISVAEAPRFRRSVASLRDMVGKGAVTAY